MGREYKVGDEPVPGYRLVAMLGKGGFGTVWRAAGPGRTEVALKITDMLDSKRGMREFKSLRLMKRVRHPNLVPIVAIWLIDSEGVPLDDDSIDLLGSNVIDREGRAGTGTATMQFNAARAERLIVAMGLGEKDLLDLLHQYQAKGEQAIPIDQLLDYMDEAAKAIDFLNEPRHNLDESGKGSELKAIYHCDIKPGNIMLVGNAAQVCDFGLARRGDVRATSVALSCAYGAPELYWENKSTQGTDQYSLAVTYYELRTGELPFDQDSSQLEVMQLHRDGKLDFRRVGEPERAVLKRATNPKPQERYPSCKEMVAALRMAVRGGSDLFRYAIDPRQSGLEPQLRSTLVPGRQLVSGYRLGEHLFHADTRTDVWSATGPGGKHYSLWIYDLTSLSETVDLAALRTIQQQMQHVHLARISGWWCLNAAGEDITAATAEKKETDAETTQLVIASEFSRTHLGHKAQERRELTESGIPAEELIEYVRQASGAIDALNAAVYGPEYASLLHTDIRPANFLLVGNTVKLANLAWCRLLVGDEAEVAGLDTRPPRITMAPEVLEGRLNRRSDQYSLAVSYVQLRSGKLQIESGLPSATTQILSAPELDLSVLSPEERTVIDRALSHDPKRRFANCQSMVEALDQVVAKLRSPELIPVSKGPAEIDRGTVVPDMPPAAATTTTSVARHRETSPTMGSTTEPDMPLPVRRARSLSVLLGCGGLLTISITATAAVLFGLVPWNKPSDQGVAVVTDDNGQATTTSTTTDSSAEKEADAVVSPPASPEEEFTQHLAVAEKQFDGGNVDDGEESLKQAKALLDQLPDPAAAREQLGLAEARLALEQKQWTAAAQRLEPIDVKKLASAERTRFYLLRALTVAEFDGHLPDNVDALALSKAIADVRRHLSGWQDASYRRDHLSDKMAAVIHAVLERAADLSADPNSEAQNTARGILAAFDPAEIGAFDRDTQVAFALATVNTRLVDPSSTWTAIEPTWQNCMAQAAWLSRDDKSRLAARLLGWSESAGDLNALAKVLKAYDSLGDVPPSPQYAAICIQVLEQLACATPIDWTALEDNCEKTRKVAQQTSHPRLYFVQLCEAECALQLERDARKRAGEALRKMPSRPAQFSPASDESYYVYVAMRVEREDRRQPDSADVDRLCDAFAKPSKLLAAEERRTSGAGMLVDAAQMLATAPEASPLGTLSFSPPDNADHAYRWLTQAKALKPEENNADFAMLLAAASLDKTQPQVPESLPTVPEKPLSSKRTVLSLRARAAELGSKHAEAVRAYAGLLRTLELSSVQSDLAMVYSNVIKPALGLATNLGPEDLKSANADIGYLYATKGRLLRLDATVAFKVYEESEGQLFGSKAVFDAYDKAIEHDPSVADYYIQRGTARYNSPSAVNNLAALERDDISNAKRLPGADARGLASLNGVASLLKARASQTREERFKLFQEAEGYERQAVEGCDESSVDYPQFLLLHSMACLELANWTTEPPQAIEGHLKLAVNSANKLIAIDRGARPDLAYQALGNAQEDFGLLLHQFSGYQDALETFETWRLKTSASPLTPAYEALISLGRARYRLGASGAKSASDSEKLFREGLVNLQAAVDDPGIPPQRAAEALSWQAQIYTARMQRTSQTNEFNDARNAADAAWAKALEVSDRPDWRMAWASLGTTADVTRSRAAPLLQPLVAKSYAPQAVMLIVNRGITARSGKDRRLQFDKGLNEFRASMPYLPDVGKAQKDDVTSLLNLAEYLLPEAADDRPFWRDNRDLCQSALKRALTLAPEADDPTLSPRAHADLAKHLSYTAFEPSTTDVLAILRSAASELKLAVDFDDALDDAPLMAFERHYLRQSLAVGWRRLLAGIYTRIAADRSTSAAEAQQFCTAARRALDNAKEVRAHVFDKERLTLQTVEASRGLTPPRGAANTKPPTGR